MPKKNKQVTHPFSKNAQSKVNREDSLVSNEESSIVGEPAQTYASLRLMGQANIIGEMLSNKRPVYSEFELISMVASGVTKGSIDQLSNNLGISRKSMAEKILDVSVKTMERKSTEDKLDKKTSSHALEIARVMRHAYEVFEDNEKIKRWINRENKALNGMKPIELFDTLTGLNLVNDILGRIEEGVYS